MPNDTPQFVKCHACRSVMGSVTTEVDGSTAFYSQMRGIVIRIRCQIQCGQCNKLHTFRPSKKGIDSLLRR